ncbi:MAG: hypothetical protein ACM357_06420 [Gemmatimonadota bacterium]
MPSHPCPQRPFAIAVVLAAACTDAGARQTAILTDSAGVRIVESHSAAWEAGEAWRLDSVPALRIGGEEDAEPAYDLLQVSDAVRLSDGRIALINNGTSELRFYDRAGRHLRTVGRSGDGPGEFRAMETLDRSPGDTLHVYDYLLRRFTSVAPDGTLLRSTGLRAALDGAFLQPLARLTDGSWVATAQVFSGEGEAGVRRDSLTLLRLASGVDSIADSIGRFPATEMYISRGGEGANRFVTFSLVPFGLSTRVVAGANRIFVGNPERYLIQVFRPDGGLERSLRRPIEREPVAEEEVARLREHELGEADPRFREQIKAKWANAPVAALKPAFARLSVDAEGALWVEGPRVLESDAGYADVFDREGRLLGQVPLPGGFRITDIGADYVLGVARDGDTGLEQVRVYALDRGPRQIGD